MTQDCHFSVEYHGGYIALRDVQGQYLAPIGSRAVLKTRSTAVTKDELFSLEDSLPQASFVAASNARYVSVKQGIIKRSLTTVPKCDVGVIVEAWTADMDDGDEALSPIHVVVSAENWCVRLPHWKAGSDDR